MSHVGAMNRSQMDVLLIVLTQTKMAYATCLDVGTAFLSIHSIGALGIYCNSEKSAFTDAILCRFF
jgi:hypothetical protein